MIYSIGTESTYFSPRNNVLYLPHFSVRFQKPLKCVMKRSSVAKYRASYCRWALSPYARCLICLTCAAEPNAPHAVCVKLSYAEINHRTTAPQCAADVLCRGDRSIKRYNVNERRITHCIIAFLYNAEQPTHRTRVDCGIWIPVRCSKQKAGP